MIDPAGILKQAERAYPRFLSTHMRGGSFFPLPVRFARIKPSDMMRYFSDIDADIKLLKAQSKEAKGTGYTLSFTKVRNKQMGEQAVLTGISFETATDYLAFLGKESEFAQFCSSVELIHHEMPELGPWLIEHPLDIVQYWNRWPELLAVCAYFKAQPQPNLYIRELPIAIHTKFIEWNASILKSLLDFLLGDTVAKNKNRFEERYGLKFDEQLIRIRILDAKISMSCFNGLDDLSIPYTHCCSLSVPCKTVLIVENKMNFLALPQIDAAIAIWGRGFQVGLLEKAEWLKGKRVIYWGDIDLSGFQILSQLRACFPLIESLLMDRQTFAHFANFRGDDPDAIQASLNYLTPDENEFYQYLCTLKSLNRLEQERIEHSFSCEKIREQITA